MCKLLSLRRLQKIAMLMFAIALIPGKSVGQNYSYNPATTVVDTIPWGNNSMLGAQYIFTPSDLSPATPASGGVITSIYVKAGNTSSGGGTFSNLQVSMGAVSTNSFTGGTWLSGLSINYLSTSSTIASWTSNGWVKITLQTPFTWNGTSNIVVGLYQTGATSPLNLLHGTVTGRNSRTRGDIRISNAQTDETKLAAFGFDLACNGVPDQPTITNTHWSNVNPLCSGSTATLTGTYPNPTTFTGVTYQWQSSSSATGPWASVTGGTGATTLSYTTAALTATTYFRLAATCTTTGQKNFSLVYQVPVGTPQPGLISASKGACPGDTVIYSVPNVSGTVYSWTLPTGWVGSSASNSISVVPGTSTGIVTVTATSSCGPTSILQTHTPAAGSVLSAPGNIFGNTLICPGTSQTYTTLPVAGARSYIWSLPSGWVGTSTTNSITVTAGTSSGNITVKSVNGCGASGSNIPFNVNVISTLPSPGTISGADTVCSGTLQVYSVAPVSGATSYTWLLPSGWSGTTASSSIQTFPGAGVGTITVTANGTCTTNSSSSSKAVFGIATLAPAVTVTKSASTICEYIPVTFTAVPANGGTNPTFQWKKNGNVILGATSRNYTDNHILGTDVITVSMVANSRCQNGVTATSAPAIVNVSPAVLPGISISSYPPISICDGTSVTFNTTRQGTGPNPTFQWYKNGLVIASANSSTYTDAKLKDSDTLTVEMKPSISCTSDTIAYSNKVGVHVDSLVVPEANISVDPSEVAYPNATLTFTVTQTGGGATPTYQWQKNGVDIAFETGDTYISNSLKPNDHISVRMVSYEKCATPGVVNSNTIILKSYLGVNGHQTLAALNIYPNPNSGRFTLAAQGWEASLIGKQLRIDVLSPLGQSVYHVELNPSSADWKTQVDLGSSISNGQYMLRVSTADGAFRSTMPFVLNR
jgi:hypothetical protein